MGDAIHLYRRLDDGTAEPVREVPYANAKKGMRKPTLADARKQGLYPGVTGIIGDSVRKQGLEIWKVNQAIEATALVLSHNLEELTDEVRAAIKEEAAKIGAEAANKGTMLHGAIDDGLNYDWSRPLPEEVDEETIVSFRKWADAHLEDIIALEYPFVSNLGYAGTIDCVAYVDGVLTYLDWKTQKTKRGKVVFYPEWAIQLAGYAYGDPAREDNEFRIMNVGCSTSEPGLIDTHVWENPRSWYQTFLSIFHVWQSPAVKNFHPTIIDPIKAVREANKEV